MRLVDAYYDEYTGVSYATVIHTINGIERRFEGISRIHPEEEHASKFTGCRYAEMRAQIKALKAERESLIWKCNECRNFVKACGQYNNWDRDSAVAKVVYRQLNRRIKEVNALTDKITQLQWDLNIAIRQQESVNKKLSSKRAQVVIIDETNLENN